MNDRNGAPIVIGAEVSVFGSRRGTKARWVRCFVRDIRAANMDSLLSRDQVRVDNGDRSNPDLKSNGFTFAGWVDADCIAVRR